MCCNEASLVLARYAILLIENIYSSRHSLQREEAQHLCLFNACAFGTLSYAINNQDGMRDDLRLRTGSIQKLWISSSPGKELSELIRTRRDRLQDQSESKDKVLVRSCLARMMKNTQTLVQRIRCSALVEYVFPQWRSSLQKSGSCFWSQPMVLACSLSFLHFSITRLGAQKHNSILSSEKYTSVTLLRERTRRQCHPCRSQKPQRG